MAKNYRCAVVGATGAVGRQMVRMLEERDFPVSELRLFASERSEGKTLGFRGKEVPVEVLKEDSFEGQGIEFLLFSAGSKISKEYAPRAVAAGGIVIDNSSAWRMDKDVPLVVPEVNSDALGAGKRLIANPNCSTIQMVQVLSPLHKRAKIKRVVVATYQAVSGAGQKAVQELECQTRALVDGNKPPRPFVFPHQIAFNCIPQIDVFLENAYTREEIKMVNETRKIMGEPEMVLTATCVRVPVYRGHSEAVNIEFEKELTAEDARDILSGTTGVVVVDDTNRLKYPMAIDAAGRAETFVGRIRRDDSVKYGLNLWVVSDNLLKGAALNAVQIAEEIVRRNLP